MTKRFKKPKFYSILNDIWILIIVIDFELVKIVSDDLLFWFLFLLLLLNNIYVVLLKTPGHGIVGLALIRGILNRGDLMVSDQFRILLLAH